MGNQLCPGSTKDFIQGFRQLEKGEKQYHPLFKCCMNHDTVQNYELPSFQDYFQEKDQENQPSTNENSKIQSYFLIKEENRVQGQLLSLSNVEKKQCQQLIVKEVVDFMISDGWRYKGDAIGSIPEGKGQEHGPNGEHFIGHFSKGKKQGYGTYHFANGSVYKGEFKDNLMWGSGLLEFPNGDHFEGQFVKNMRDGKGKYTLHQPNIEDLLFFEGQYANDVKHGAGLMKYVDYEVHGNWKNGHYNYSFQTECNERH